ncbi:hypothetical protein ACMXYW_13675 [Neptuniibacter sp. QD48_55]|uniref:hypothetical protein n=1 Tax=Neptuniibacter sp. QD48_55 TaxID=3398212 RepID=UPI0039F4ABAB
MKKRNIEKGDLLKSNPLDGYWVCSIVLTHREKSESYSSGSHVAITNAVFDHDFDLSEIDTDNLEIIHTTNFEGYVVPCIEMYASKLVNGIEVIGQVSSEHFYKHALEFKIGRGHDGGWPSCGPLKKSLGHEAVHQWRSINDSEAWLKDIREAEKKHSEMIVRLNNGNRHTEDTSSSQSLWDRVRKKFNK